MAAPGLTVQAFARGLTHPRWLHVLPNGDVFVAETNAPRRPGTRGVKHFIMKQVQTRGGAINHHWTWDLVAATDGRVVHATVGSNSNVAESGLAAEEGRAAVWLIDPIACTRPVSAARCCPASSMAIDVPTDARSAWRWTGEAGSSPPMTPAR